MSIGENVGECVGENTGSSGRIITSGDYSYPQPGNTNYFSWDAESTTVQNPSTTGTLDGGAAIVSGGVGGGNCMRIPHSYAQSAKGLNIPAHQFYGVSCYGLDLYQRFFAKIETGFDWGFGAKKIKMSRVGDESTLIYTGYFDYAKGVGVDECDANCDPDPEWYVPYTFNADSMWREYIFRVLMNTNGNHDGAIQLWVSNTGLSQQVFIDEQTGIQIAASGRSNYRDLWAAFGLWPFDQLRALDTGSGPEGGYIWYDDYSIDTKWNSLIGPKP